MFAARLPVTCLKSITAPKHKSAPILKDRGRCNPPEDGKAYFILYF
jgi:hypothetical protein